VRHKLTVPRQMYYRELHNTQNSDGGRQDYKFSFQFSGTYVINVGVSVSMAKCRIFFCILILDLKNLVLNVCVCTTYIAPVNIFHPPTHTHTHTRTHTHTHIFIIFIFCSTPAKIPYKLLTAHNIYWSVHIIN
jgi:hypothetical protein